MAPQDEIVRTVTNNKWKIGTVVALIVGFSTIANNYNVFGGYFWTASAQAIHVQEQASRDARQDVVVQDVLDSNQQQRNEAKEQMHAIEKELVKLTTEFQNLNRRLDRERRNR